MGICRMDNTRVKKALLPAAFALAALLLNLILMSALDYGACRHTAAEEVSRPPAESESLPLQNERRGRLLAELAAAFGIPALLFFILYMRAAKKREDETICIAKEKFESITSSAAHDLNSPLRGIDGLAAILQADCADKLGDEGKDYLRRIRGESARMKALVSALQKLTDAISHTLSAADVDLSAEAKQAAEALNAQTPQKKTSITIAAGLTASGDRFLLRELIENLLSNAWKFTAKKETAEVTFGAEEQNGRTVFFVRDNGEGFDMEYAGKLFQPFQRLHSPTEFPGPAIGLSTARCIVERHGGRIWAEGAEGKGATFYFTLPAK